MRKALNILLQLIIVAALIALINFRSENRRRAREARKAEQGRQFTEEFDRSAPSRYR